MSKETVIRIIKSCIVSRKGGIPMCEIENDYKDLVGQSIPYIALGYRNLKDFIHSIDFIDVVTNYFGDSVLFVSDPKVAHIDSLVSKQKNAPVKQKRRNRYGKSRRGNNKFAEENRTPPSRYRRRENENRDNYRPEKENRDNYRPEKENRDNYRPENFRKNTRMEYTQSKWYSDRPKDSWKKKTYENREMNRYNNFNNGRPALHNWSNNSSQNDNSWSGRTASPSSVEENTYNFNSPQEKRYAQESRRWRFQVQVADNANSTVGKYQQSQRCDHQQYNPFVSGQLGGGPTNNYNYWSRNWYDNPYQVWSSRDNQSGQWWPGQQGHANMQFPWIGEVFLEPLLNENQLIGDDFFLQLAIQDFKAESQKARVGAAIRCGLCISGQTIDECRQRLEKTQFLSGNIMILLGSVDIYRGHSLESMVSDMKKLLDVCRTRFKLPQITLCTIPPLANYSVRFNLRKLSVLHSFNNWIKLHSNFGPDDSYIHHYNVIDLFSRFTDCNHKTLYDYFQIDARMVSGCAYPYILWNSKGRRTAISMLKK